MKLPKFRKNSTHLERQASLARSNRQLLLTDTRYRIQPQKFTTTVEAVKELATPVKANNPPKLPSTQPPQLAQTPILFQMRKNNNKSVDLNSSRIVGSGRFAKSAQPKRLQRNRALVSSKPNYTLRPRANAMVTPASSRQRLSPVYQEITSPSTPSITRNLFKKNIAFDETANEFDFVDAGSVKKVAAPTLNPTINIESVNTPTNQRQQQQPAEYLAPTSNASQRTLASATPASRFSLSKLTKFVSKSALKLINSNGSRKSMGSNGSSPEVMSPDSSVNISPSNSMMTDDDTRTSENFYFTVQPTCQVEPAQVAPQQMPSFNESIYKSFEQYKQMEAKINQTSLNRVRSSAQCKEQPIMGITSVLLKQYKKANSSSSSSSRSSGYSTNSSSLSTYIGSTTFLNPYLIAAPIVINTSTESFESSNSSGCYDKLAQRRVNSQTIDKKNVSSSSHNIVRPILKSLSSLTNTVPKNQAKSPIVNSHIYNDCKSRPVYYKVEQELHYESFNESIF